MCSDLSDLSKLPSLPLLTSSLFVPTQGLSSYLAVASAYVSLQIPVQRTPAPMAARGKGQVNGAPPTRPRGGEKQEMCVRRSY